MYFFTVALVIVLHRYRIGTDRKLKVIVELVTYPWMFWVQSIDMCNELEDMMDELKYV